MCISDGNCCISTFKVYNTKLKWYTTKHSLAPLSEQDKTQIEPHTKSKTQMDKCLNEKVMVKKKPPNQPMACINTSVVPVTENYCIVPQIVEKYQLSKGP